MTQCISGKLRFITLNCMLNFLFFLLKLTFQAHHGKTSFVDKCFIASLLPASILSWQMGTNGNKI